MNFFGKYFLLRLVIGAVFGFALAKAVSDFDLFDFTLAREISFVFVLLSFLFLSQKYTVLMLVATLCGALYLGYRVQTFAELVPTESTDWLRQRKLFLEVVRYKLEGEKSLVQAKLNGLAFCERPACPTFLQATSDANFWFFEVTSNANDDKDQGLWYIDEHFKTLKRNPL